MELNKRLRVLPDFEVPSTWLFPILALDVKSLLALKCSVLEVVPVEVRCPLLHLRCTARVMFQSGMKMLAGKVLRVDDDP